MLLRDLDDKRKDIKVVLLQTLSPKLMLLLEDKIKRRYSVTMDSSFFLESKKDFQGVRQVHGVTPPFASKWYVRADLDAVKWKDVADLAGGANTCVFFCTCSRYAVYKKFKEALKDEDGVFDFYIRYLRRNDFIYLYDSFVTGDNKLTKKMFDYVAKSYSGDIEAVIDLFTALAGGAKVESRKDVSSICGIGGLSVESFVFSLTTPLSGSAKGLKRVMQNRIQAGIDLCNTLGCKSMYNFMNSCLNALCEIKMMLIAGVVYKDLRGISDKNLEKYSRYVWRLKEIPMSRLLRIKNNLGGNVWSSDKDFLNFIYKFYTHEVLEGGAVIVNNC